MLLNIQTTNYHWLWLLRVLETICHHLFVKFISVTLLDANSKHSSLLRIFSVLFSNAFCKVPLSCLLIYVALISTFWQTDWLIDSLWILVNKYTVSGKIRADIRDFSWCRLDRCQADWGSWEEKRAAVLRDTSDYWQASSEPPTLCTEDTPTVGEVPSASPGMDTY